MHELSIASALVQSVLEFARMHPVRRVLEVRMSVGELTCVENDQLRFCYDAVTKETALEDSTLEIEAVQAKVKCPHCDYCGRPKYWDDLPGWTPVVTLQCPACGRAADAVEGHECAIKAIKYVN